MNATRTLPTVLATLTLVFAAPLCAANAAGIRLASANPAGIPGSGNSRNPSISGNSRFVAFDSIAEDLVPGSGIGSDVFVTDLATGEVELISRSASGGAANDESLGAVISADGRFVAFASAATNLVSPAISTQVTQVYLRDRQTGVTTLVSASASGAPATSSCFNVAISGNGRIVAFDTSANNLVAGDTNSARDVFRFDADTGHVTLESRSSTGVIGNDDSSNPTLDFDGEILAYESDATNLEPGDTNGVTDVFLHDRSFSNFGLTKRLTSIDELDQPNGRTFRPSISSNGRLIAFASDATNLVPGDTNGRRDVFLFRHADTITRVSVLTDGTQGSRDSDIPAISGNGRFVAFVTASPELGAGGSTQAALVVDTATGNVRAASRRRDQASLVSSAFFPSLDFGGTSVAFASADPGIVKNDANGASDVFAERAPFIAAGDVLTGDTGDLDTAREVSFDAVKGMKLTLVLEQAPDDTEIEVRLIAPNGHSEKKITLENDDDDTLKISKTGLFRLRFQHKDGGDGAFRIATILDLPKAARDFEDDDRLDAGESFQRKVLLLPGSRFRIAGAITPEQLGNWIGRLQIGRPDGLAAIAIDADVDFSATVPVDSFTIEIPVRQLGRHRVKIASDAGVDVRVDVAGSVELPESGAVVPLE